MSKRTNLLKMATAGALVSGLLVLGACAPQATPPAATDAADASPQELAMTGIPAPVEIADRPVVYQYPDGTLVQRTPSEDQESPDYNMPAQYVPSNVVNLHADAKGCNSCHPDLGELVYNMSLEGGRYDHYDMRAKLGTNVDVNQCMSCHALRGRPSQTVEGEFGNLIHGIHQNIDGANCWSCHAATDATSTDDVVGSGNMVVWDLFKYDLLRGIKDIADEDMPDSFNYRTDETWEADKDWTVQWFGGPEEGWRDEERSDQIKAGDEIGDPEIFDNWTITITGMVDKEITWTLPELIATAPSETHVQKKLCAHNPTNGPWIYQGEWTGIPIEWFLEQAGVQEGATSVSLIANDGASSHYPIEEATDPERNDMICYELNGERLRQTTGYPVVYKAETRGANDERREIVEIQVGDREVDPHELHGNHEFTKPDVGIFDLRDGQIFQTGQPIQFHGYAECYNQEVAAVEISMDRGKTWKRFDTPDHDMERLMTWTYDWTPEEAGSYCIYVRGVSGNAWHPNGDIEYIGETTQDPLKIMVTVVDQLPEPDVVLEEGDIAYN
ncbi:molybdopterin-dependent oxidoreductase [uncultured Adlercreutzia sp.]|uniref:molybdopterin-dependent oxidoreductase n=1 Tax=uncultured Adlercreutzia sp. TaxID=875803 RepID=UPI0025CEB6B7|nr:molybdopterin-dependent oxidoreductase [uncultured Adlercreutzia sp.]